MNRPIPIALEEVEVPKEYPQFSWLQSLDQRRRLDSLVNLRLVARGGQEPCQGMSIDRVCDF
jgi:hypothetical protein